MSTVLSYNTDRFKILISDTRTTKFSKESKTFDDSTLKIHYIDNYGFLTGIGIGELANNTFNELLKYHVNDINYNILQESFRISYKSIRSKCDKEVLLNQSAVIISNNDTIWLFSNKLLSFIPTNSVTINKDKLNIQYPFDISDNEKEKIYPPTQTIFTPTIENILLEMLNVFGKISTISDDVSNICSIAILGNEIESPFFLQNNVNEIANSIKMSSFNSLKNEFEKYKLQLTSWQHI